MLPFGVIIADKFIGSLKGTLQRSWYVARGEVSRRISPAVHLLDSSPLDSTPLKAPESSPDPSLFPRLINDGGGGGRWRCTTRYKQRKVKRARNWSVIRLECCPDTILLFFSFFFFLCPRSSVGSRKSNYQRGGRGISFPVVAVLVFRVHKCESCGLRIFWRSEDECFPI